MGAPVPKVEAAENASAEALLSSLETIATKERRKHASVFNYWLSIRGNRQFPPIRDLDPLELSDASPVSVLLEMIGGGEDAEIRHLGQAITAGVEVERISEAPSPSLLSCIYAKLPTIAASRQAFAFEDEFTTDNGTTRCWVTLLPFSQSGTWIDYVYGFVSLDGEQATAEVEPASEEPVPVEAPPEIADTESEPFKVPLGPLDEEPESAEAMTEPFEVVPDVLDLSPEPAEAMGEPLEAAPETLDQSPEPIQAIVEPVDVTPETLEELPQPETGTETVSELSEVAPEAVDETYEPQPEAVEETYEAELEADEAPAPASRATKPGFSARLLEGLASVSGFYGQAVPVAPSSSAPACPEQLGTDVSAEAIPEEEPAQPTHPAEGPLHSKLSEVRAKAEEARLAQERCNNALMEGLSAAYDFALDAEQEPEEYLRLVESQGLKIQLRSPMKPVVKLGFDGMCDEVTITQLEAVLAWALKMDLPRGSLAERIEAEGGIGRILNG